MLKIKHVESFDTEKEDIRVSSFWFVRKNLDAAKATAWIRFDQEMRNLLLWQMKNVLRTRVQKRRRHEGLPISSDNGRGIRTNLRTLPFNRCADRGVVRVPLGVDDNEDRTTASGKFERSPLVLHDWSVKCHDIVNRSSTRTPCFPTVAHVDGATALNEIAAVTVVPVAAGDAFATIREARNLFKAGTVHAAGRC